MHVNLFDIFFVRFFFYFGHFFHTFFSICTAVHEYIGNMHGISANKIAYIF